VFAGILVIIGMVAVASYFISLRIWPETRCRRCRGSGRNAGSNARRFGRCKRCGGSGRELRRGARILDRRKH
jgi:DnaJ-class molecular chaperone